MVSWSRPLPVVACLCAFFCGVKDASADCLRCSCDNALYRQSDLATCQARCKTSLSCFTAICEPAGMAGIEPTAEQEKIQQNFPRLSCYSVTAPETAPSWAGSGTYNCIALTVGVSNRWVWREVDAYGVRDGIVTVTDFDAFYAADGYTVAANCSRQAGKEKIALYGITDASGAVKPKHAAKQAAIPVGGFLFESKEGAHKQFVHDLDDLEGGPYGAVIKCYERAVP